MSDILTDTSAGLYGALSAGTALTALLASGTLSIYDTAPVENAPLDYVIYSHSGGGAENIMSASLESNLWLVRGYSETSAKAADAIFAQIDSLLNRKSLTIGSRKCLYCWKENNVKTRQIEPTANPIWVSGAYYRIRTTST